MPLQRTETLHAYGFAVQRIQQPVIDNGQPVHDHDGNVKQQEMSALILVDQTAGHTVVIPLTDEARLELVKQLTGGLIIPNGSG